MALNITPVTNHREREKGCIVYPVYSRRSAGLSVGINLFPGKKTCQFDCPYCEVFPFSANASFDLSQMEDDLRAAITAARSENIPVKDICFSGNGEPTLSPVFAEAFNLAEKIREEASPCAKLVVITNGTGLLQPNVFKFLKDAASSPSLDIWLKLDAGTSEWYQKMNRCVIPHNKLMEKIKEFTSCVPATIQTMLCAINRETPSREEAQEWEALVCALAANSKDSKAGIRKVQLYGKARAAPEDPHASSLPAEYLEKRASSLRGKFAENNITAPVEIYI